MGCCNKFALFVINFVVFGVGVAVVVLASLVISKNSTYGVMLQDGTFSLPIIVLIAGLIILLIGFLGCCGALKENSCLLQTYAGIVLVLLIAEVILAILIFVYTNQAKDTVRTGMDGIFDNYGGKDQSLTASLDHAQQDLHCCGVRNYTDWENYQYGQLHPNSVADGCCREFTKDCGLNVLSFGDIQDKIYTQGCFRAIENDIEGLAIWLGVICIILALVQLLSISCACGIAKKSSQYV